MSGVPASKSQNEDMFPVGEQPPPRLHAVSADSYNDSKNDSKNDNENDSASRTPDERRGAERLRHENRAGIAQEVSDAEEEQLFYLPRHGRGMTVSLIVAFGIAYFVTPTWPGPSPTIAALFSTTLFAAYGWFAAVERRNESVLPLRIALLVIANIVPMLCAGYALAAGISSGAPLPWAIATLVCINAAAAVFFSGRIASLFCANIASWAGFVVFAAPGLQTYAALTGAAVTLILIARIEWRAADRRRALREARERVAARAQDILRSFEESGVGVVLGDRPPRAHHLYLTQSRAGSGARECFAARIALARDRRHRPQFRRDRAQACLPSLGPLGVPGSRSARRIARRGALVGAHRTTGLRFLQELLRLPRPWHRSHRTAPQRTAGLAPRAV
jgi:hypothetical protein